MRRKGSDEGPKESQLFIYFLATKTVKFLRPRIQIHEQRIDF